MNPLNHYQQAFKSLNTDKSKGIAPHKPVLLLSVIAAYQQQIITTNRIYLTPELKYIFNVYWSALVTSPHEPRLALPFYHLRNERAAFWHLQPNLGCEIWVESKSAMRSINNLITAVEYAYIDDELCALMQQEQSREILKLTLLETYFPNKINTILEQVDPQQYTDEIRKQILEQDSTTYKTQMQNTKKNLSLEEYEEDVFVRGSIFKREVPRIYQYTCCISGWKIEATTEISMIDACHIKPFSKSFDDTISNGICLCPNLHRAFDRGLIGINTNYQVLVTRLKESDSPYNLQQWMGKRILLPDNLNFLPNPQNFAWHLKYVFREI